jgi:hypothetical protein
MRERNKSDKADDVIDLIAPWGLVLLASLTACGAILRIFGGAEADILKRLDNTTLLYLVIAGALLLFRQVKTFNFGDIKLEMLEKVRQRQVQQEETLYDFDLLLPLLIPKEKRRHLINLDKGRTKDYKGNKSLRDELRWLRSSGLISMRKGYIADIKDGITVNLSDYVELTNLGQRWAKRITKFEDQSDNLQDSGNDAGEAG